MSPDAEPTLRAPSPADDPSLTAAVAALRAIATEPLTVERVMQLTGVERGDVVLALRALKHETVIPGVVGAGEREGQR